MERKKFTRGLLGFIPILNSISALKNKENKGEKGILKAGRVWDLLGVVSLGSGELVLKAVFVLFGFLEGFLGLKALFCCCFLPPSRSSPAEQSRGKFPLQNIGILEPLFPKKPPKQPQNRAGKADFRGSPPSAQSRESQKTQGGFFHGILVFHGIAERGSLPPKSTWG